MHLSVLEGRLQALLRCVILSILSLTQIESPIKLPTGNKPFPLPLDFGRYKCHVFLPVSPYNSI